MASNLITSSKASLPNVTKLDIKSNSGGALVSLLSGNALYSIEYYESIFQDTVKATVIFSDTGDSVNGKSVIEGLPLVGTEEVNMTISDGNEKQVKVTLYVNEVIPIVEEAKKAMTSIKLVSEEFIQNECGDTRVKGRFSGKISDHVTKILQRNLKSKRIDVEPTNNNYNFIANNRKPFYIINWLSRYSIPSKAGKEGKTGGFLLFQTSEGIKFKSIDGLFSQPHKRKFIYNQNVDKDGKVPAGYDGKILSYTPANAINAQEKFQIGAYATRLIVFDPFNCKYEIIEEQASKDGVKLGAKNLPKFNDKFKSVQPGGKGYTRTTYMLIDKGTLPVGSTDEQVKKAEEENLNVKKTLNQSIRRYNQMIAAVETITIAGDFSLHAGDTIYCDFPGLRPQRDESTNEETGGLYIISDLCHYIVGASNNQVFTKLNLIRDSFGRQAAIR